MNVYAQQTDENTRLCSLLSSVLNRRLRPEFVDAIQRKGEILEEDRSISLSSLSRRITGENSTNRLRLIFVGPSLAIEFLSRQSSIFSSRYIFDVSLLPLSIQSSSPLRSIQRILQELQRTVSHSKQEKQRIVLVSVTSGVDLVYQFLTSERYDTATILGLVAIDPPHYEMIPFLPLFIPIFVAMTKSQDTLSDAQLVHRSNPNTIMVYGGMDADCTTKWDSFVSHDKEEKEDDDSDYQEEDFSSFWRDPLCQWLARCVAKFAEAVANLDRNETSMILPNNPNSEDRRGKIWEMTSKL